MDWRIFRAVFFFGVFVFCLSGALVTVIVNGPGVPAMLQALTSIVPLFLSAAEAGLGMWRWR